MATEKTTGRQAVGYGGQVAGLRDVCDGLAGAVAEGLDGHFAAGFISCFVQLRSWARLASVAERAGAAGRAR